MGGSTYTKHHRVHPEGQDLAAGGRRGNAFYKDGSENANPFPVIFEAKVPRAGAGTKDPAFFAMLGDHRHPVGSTERNAEQEYLLQNMPKGAMYDASVVADRYGIGVGVRGTGVLAHQGIESGAPT